MHYVVEDDLHCDITISFPTVEEALAEIRRRVALPWDHEDNEPPCVEPQNCERPYCLYECADGHYPDPTFSGRSVLVCTISSKGVVWGEGVEEELATWSAAP